MFSSDYIEFCREKMLQNGLNTEQVNSSLSHIYVPLVIKGGQISIYTQKGGSGGGGDWGNQNMWKKNVSKIKVKMT